MLTVDVEVIRGGEGWNSVAMAGAEVTEPSDDLNGPGIEPQWGKGRRWGGGGNFREVKIVSYVLRVEAVARMTGYKWGW